MWVSEASVAKESSAVGFGWAKEVAFASFCFAELKEVWQSGVQVRVFGLPSRASVRGFKVLAIEGRQRR